MEEQIMIGAEFQCHVPPFSKSLIPKHTHTKYADCIWDPVRSELAKEQGEAIGSFLRPSRSFILQAHKMEALHKCDYRVAAARELLPTLHANSIKLPADMMDEDDKELFAAMAKAQSRKHRGCGP